MTKNVQYILYLVLLAESLDNYIYNPHKEGIVMLIIARKKKKFAIYQAWKQARKPRSYTSSKLRPTDWSSEWLTL